MAVVVRCTGCRGASQVGPEAVGLLVVCPRCKEPFLAIEDAPVATASSPTPKPRRPRAEPIDSPRERVRPRRRRREIDDEPLPSHHSHDPHDPPIASSGNLPVSVLIGFALLPFAIPLLWLIGPMLLTQPPALSLAAPASLSLAASVLCLAVVFTVDWSPATRIKGVLMLVGLSYFAGLSLYFLKKEMVDRAKEFFGSANSWHEFQPPGGEYKVRLPVFLPPNTNPIQEQPLPGFKLQCYRIAHQPLTGSRTTYQFGSGPDANKAAANWFEDIEKALKLTAGADAQFGAAIGVRTLDDKFTGQQWSISFPNRPLTRIVRVFHMHGMVYYLSVEGDQINAEDQAAELFLRSLMVQPPVGQ
ncbi:MAG TPA: hypothetical protein VGL71_08510 [Urbifossiella sp.]